MGPRKQKTGDAPDTKPNKETAIESVGPRPPAAREERKRKKVYVVKDGPDASQNSKLIRTLQGATSDELLNEGIGGIGSRLGQPNVECNPQNDCAAPAMSAGCSKEEFSNTRQKKKCQRKK